MKNDNRKVQQTNTNGFPTVCLKACRSGLEQLSRMKKTIAHEFSSKVAGYEQVLRSALNEAEALAWDTQHPLLFFPELAQEKARGASRWAKRQTQLDNRPLALPA